MSCAPWKVKEDGQELGTICTKNMPIVDIEQGEGFDTQYEGLHIACGPWKVKEGTTPSGISCTMEGINSNIFSSLSTKKADVVLGAPKEPSEPYTVYLNCAYSEN